MIRNTLLLLYVTLAGAQSDGTQSGNYSQYGGSPPVYPSRELEIYLSFRTTTDLPFQPISRELEDGRQQ